ncbi:MAG: YifB family Mg chelatase-like AAA ATPase [Treponema sp.]|nr:YifB family Mg chelatase-like AAA ATPase [Treponema sp.]
MEIYSFSPFGYEGSLVTVEVDLRRGIPAVDVVGLADGAVKEARERMQAAIRNSGFDFPPERVLISLSPADLKKEGAGFDLPIALSVLAANEISENSSDNFMSDSVLIMGELELSGKIRAVKGVHAACSTAQACGISRCIVPQGNADEAREVTGMLVYGADTLSDALNALKNPDCFSASRHVTDEQGLPAGSVLIDGVYFGPVMEGFEFSELRGQEKLVRALQIAAAGGHNLMAVGAPGCGKTMAVQKLPALLPLLTKEEAQSVTRIWSLAGILQPSEPIIRTPPFRMPHSTATLEGLCGGGPQCRPGEISLAHNGVLFLDEAAEFRTTVLQTLRVPLESSRITLSRAGRSTVYPANFQLMLAANPCPCGNYGNKSKICLCSASAIDHYWKKFSAPLLDRVDLRVSVSNESENGFDESQKTLSTNELRRPIAKAVSIQRKRQGCKNASLTPEQTGSFCPLNAEVKKTLDKAVVHYGFSPRATASIIKTARTIADMDGSVDIQKNHLDEAVDFRKVFNNLAFDEF